MLHQNEEANKKRRYNKDTKIQRYNIRDSDRYLKDEEQRRYGVTARPGQEPESTWNSVQTVG